MTDKRTVGDCYSINRASFRDQGALATARFEYLVEKRDAVQSKIRFGALTLNGASLVGLSALLSTDMAAIAILGLTEPGLKASAWHFIGGMVAAVLSLWLVGNHVNGETAFAFDRMCKASWLNATMEGDMGPENEAKMFTAMDEFHECELTDFSYSRTAMFFSNLSGSLWIVGVASLAWDALGWPPLF